MTAVIIAFIILALIELPPLIRQKHWKDLTVFSFFFLVSLTLALLVTKGVPVYSPVKGVIFIFKDLLKIGYD
jgi:hypothetical protein